MPCWIKAFYFACLARFIITACCADGVPEISAKCQAPRTMEFCYSLHGTDSDDADSQPLNWNNASELCTADGKRLAVVDSPDAQRLVAGLVRDLDGDLNQVWIGGRRRYRDRHWSYLNGTSFKDAIDEYYQSSCVKLYLDKHGLVKYGQIRCTDQWNVYALCHYEESQQECRGFYHSGLCYFVSDTHMNWFDAMTYCYNETNGDGTLAYAGLDTNDVRQWLNSVRNNSYSLELLVGVRREPWVWATVAGDVSLVYFNWGKQAGDYDGDRCITMVPKENQQWQDVPCKEMWYYFICQNGSRPSTTTTATTLASTVLVKRTPVTGSTILSTQGDQHVVTDGQERSVHVSTVKPEPTPGGTRSAPSTAGDNGPSLKTEHIVAIIVGIVIIAAIIGTVLAIQRCSSKNENSEAAGVTETKSDAALQQATEEVVIKEEEKQNGVIQNAQAEQTEPTMTIEGDDNADGTSDASDATAEGKETNGVGDFVSPPEQPSPDAAADDTELSEVQHVVEEDAGRDELCESIEDTAIWVAL